tara:strand:+ start:8818 stop:10650 length:1833 start_codon:yes stop_codon:yes gene_type:complete
MKQPFTVIFGGEWTPNQQKKVAETTTPFYFSDDSNIQEIIKKHQPQVYVTIGPDARLFKNLARLPKHERSKWVHFKSVDDLMTKINQIYYCFVNWGINYRNDPEMITIFTTSYKSGEMIKRPLNTLLNQTYQHWEWVIFDDTSGDENWKNLVALRESDPRIRVYRAEKNSGVIGHMKNLASSLARGGLLIEVDHDDDLTPRALELCAMAAKDYPEAGFFHSDFVEIHEDGRNFKYGDMFGLGYGSYRKEWNEERQMWVNVVNCIPMNPATIRYLVACPNHFRAWRTETFKKIGGWNPHFHVADDYEMMARSFCNTKFVKIRHNCYYQYRNSGGNNHTFIRNREIQKLWHNISRYYNPHFNKRFNELGVEDPYFKNWENYRQWQRCWLRDEWEDHLCETLKIRGRTPGKPLVSLAMVCYDKEDIIKVKLGIELALRQSYGELEITAVGNKLEEFEKLMDSIVSLWETELQQREQIDSNRKDKDGNEMGAKFFGNISREMIDRAKHDLRWWNTDQIHWFRGVLNYICKASSEGELVCYFDTNNLQEIEKFYKNEFIQKAVDMLVQDSELQMVCLKDTKHFIHRRDLFKKYGFWGVKKDLFEIFKKQEKYQEI